MFVIFVIFSKNKNKMKVHVDQMHKWAALVDWRRLRGGPLPLKSKLSKWVESPMQKHTYECSIFILNFN